MDPQAPSIPPGNVNVLPAFDPAMSMAPATSATIPGPPVNRPQFQFGGITSSGRYRDTEGAGAAAPQLNLSNTVGGTPSQTPTGPLTPARSKFLIVVLTGLFESGEGEPWLKPIDEAKSNCPGYYRTIRKPMDLETITRKLSDYSRR
jgi:hypothetical protein